MAKAMIVPINAKLASLHHHGKSATPQFQWDGATGHHRTPINHDCQKHHEERIVVAILDVMEQMGWRFRFQHDAAPSACFLAREEQARKTSHARFLTWVASHCQLMKDLLSKVHVARETARADLKVLIKNSLSADLTS
jgi:hypothetical protein